ncbi:hypothetical protein [Chryseobacterium sp. SL1]|uniref:hypothetical protein n=1 Tax=Chryseobacterium sp. SL1 TaxID=2995159 RepID=UPI002274E043|nr:hypothetical protein [Chryseobacterium sp. SL1]MCY1660193.1 hypothetical protein [Chryseobacterium sp. SL1]
MNDTINLGCFTDIQKSIYERILSDVKIKELESKVNDAFEEVVILAKNNSPEFLIRFKVVYPEFFIS